MKNIIDEKPTDALNGRTLYNTLFIDDNDIRDKKVLDVGCGFAWFELNCLQREVGHVTGIEITEKDLEAARKYLSDLRLDFKIGSAIDLRFETESFNTVVAWEVMEHVDKNSEHKMFCEVRKVLKNNGTFYLSTPYDSFVSKIFDPAWWFIGHRHYTEEQIVSLGKMNGFSVEKLVLRGGWWEIAGINNLYIAKWLLRRRPFFQNFFNSLIDNEYSYGTGFNTIFVKFRKK